ncbi:MAG: gfo/Idh/MocA family oxidoreductase, partial [Runella zeae]
MKKSHNQRRTFLKESMASAAGLMTLPMFSSDALGHIKTEKVAASPSIQYDSPRIKFAVIGMNHGHIYGQVEAVVRGGGQLVSYYAKEPDLVAAFAKRYPQAKL